jgi:myo-inositol-1(or 4)-monophosphatase
MKPTHDQLSHLERKVYETLQALRPTLLKAHGSIEHHIKDDRSVVTEMDLLVEHRLREELAKVDPSIGFGGEETGIDTDQETFWLVDPIDATEAFIRGLPFSTNMVALIDNGQPVMGVIYNFFLDEYYLAIKDRGATCNGHVIHVSQRQLAQSYVIATGNWGKLNMPNLGPHLRPRVAGMPKLHGSGCEAAYIAKGAIDGVIVAGAKGPWDFAAGNILIQEAGGRVENWDSNTYDYRDMEFVASNPLIFDELKQFILSERSNAVA